MFPSQISSGTSTSRGDEVLHVLSLHTNASRRVDRAGRRAALLLIRGYQLLLSPLFTGSCRYAPSCSAYAAEAIARFGVVRGTALAIRRLARCHPFGGYGIDPGPALAPSKLVRDEPVSAVRGKQSL